VPAGRVAREGVDICVETIQRLRQAPGVAGFHLMALGHERGIPELLDRAGLGPLDSAGRGGERRAADSAADRGTGG
jgi:hypothetical protein